MPDNHRVPAGTPLTPGTGRIKISDRIKLPPLISGEGNLRRKYDALGGAAALGEPVSKEEGRTWTFANGSCLCYNPDMFAAFEIHGDIYKKWLALGGMAWGIPCTDETGTPDGVGRFNHFNANTASIYWTPATGAAGIWGLIREKWAQMGWERSPLGYPVTDESGTPDGVGRFNHFSNAGSVYWTPGTGAHAVYGDIRARWEAMGWETSYLGYPVSDEVDFAEGGRANEFQNGGIYWWPDTGAIDLRDVVVHYTGLYCFGETDWDQSSSADEPYVIMGVTAPQVASVHRSGIYNDVDAGESRPDLIEVYRGRPYGMNICTVVMENDFGDPDKYKEDIQNVVMGVHDAGTRALGLIPILGPVIAAVAGPALKTLMPSIGGAINNALNLGDDRIGSSSTTVSAKQMVLLAARTPNTDFHGIGYKVESGLVSGSGASYKAHFGVVPA